MGGYTQAQRLQALPPYVFAELDRMKQEQLKKGVDIISLGIGDPDLPTPPHIIQALAMTAADPRNHQYPSYEGLLTFRKAAADWYRSRFGVTLDPATEVLTLIGRGLGTRDIASQLAVSVKTVETHQARIKEKLGLTHVRELTRAAVSWSLQ